jgi:cytidylate kinase
MFRIITVEREYGCGGGTIAAQLAERLGWKLWDHSITEEIAKIAKVDCKAVEKHEERVDSRFYRLSKVFWRGSYERSLPVGDSDIFDADCMMFTMEQITAKIAHEGSAVVVGRGSPFFLRERADTFRVFLYAPRPEKMRRLLVSGMSEGEAGELVDSIDHERRAFIKHYFNADWPTRALYHMMINTEVGDELVIATILDAMERLQGKTMTPVQSGAR